MFGFGLWGFGFGLRETKTRYSKKNAGAASFSNVLVVILAGSGKRNACGSQSLRKWVAVGTKR